MQGIGELTGGLILWLIRGESSKYLGEGIWQPLTRSGKSLKLLSLLVTWRDELIKAKL